MRIGARIVAPFVFSSLAALAGFAGDARGDVPPPPAPASMAPAALQPLAGGAGVEDKDGERYEHCKDECDFHYHDCVDHVGHAFHGQEWQCDRARGFCMDRCEHER